MDKKFYILPIIALILAGVYLIFFNKPATNELDRNDVDSRGGLATSDDAIVTVEFPAGALMEKKSIIITPKPMGTIEKWLVQNTFYQFSPNMDFQKPVKLSIKYDPEKLDEDLDEDLLFISKWNGKTWIPDSSSVVDISSNTVSAEVTSFSDYCVSGFYFRIEPYAQECIPGHTVYYQSHWCDFEGVLAGINKYTATTTNGAFHDEYGHKLEGENDEDYGACFIPEVFLYKANVDASGGVDTVSFEYQIKQEFMNRIPSPYVIDAKVTVLKTDISTAIELVPYPNKFCVPGERILFEVKAVDILPEGNLVFEWECTSDYGELVGSDPASSSVWYRAYDGALDGTSDMINVTVYAMQGDRKVFVGSAIAVTDTYNPTTVYNLCGDGQGLTFPRVGQWVITLVDHGQVNVGFKARVGDQLKIQIINQGYNPSGIYLRLGMVGSGETSATMLVSSSNVVDGYVDTFTITIG